MVPRLMGGGEMGVGMLVVWWWWCSCAPDQLRGAGGVEARGGLRDDDVR